MVELEGTLVAGKYRVKRRIGAGGMGAVYEGEHVEIGKRVAIKVIEHDNAHSEELAARFRREARAASAVESEHIVHVFDVGQDEKTGLYMVMELLAGEDLASRLEKAGGKLPVEEAVTIVTQAARALGKAHAAGVVHRDLKPANLFLTEREDGSVCVKILDFGISKLIRPGTDGKSSTLTREGSVIGTPRYMSPEQAQGLAVDARTDVWSLGSVLYEALAGRPPYEERDTYEQMIVQIVTKKPPPLRDVAPWVPEAIAAVVQTALEQDVDAREASASTFAKKLVEAAKLPRRSGSDPELSVPSSNRAIASAATVLDPLSLASRPAATASPPTATGVVVGARTQLDAGIPQKRSSTMLVVGAGVVLAALVGVVAVVTRDPSPKPGAQGGLVAPPPSQTVAAPLPSAQSDKPPTTVIVAASAPERAAAPTPSATGSALRTSAAPDAGARPSGGRTMGGGAATPAATKQGAGTTQNQGQYGAPGLTPIY